MARCRLLVGAAMVLVVLVSGGLGTAATGEPHQKRSLNSGVYTRKQADRGGKLYKRICSHCHGAEQFKGYLSGWVGLPVSYLYNSVSSTMPQDNPGGLSRKRYVDLLTYMFSINGAPTGEQEMGADAAVLDDITIELPPDEGVPERPPGLDPPAVSALGAVSAGARRAGRVTPPRAAPMPPVRPGALRRRPR